jgi:hypothetical protein
MSYLDDLAKRIRDHAPAVVRPTRDLVPLFRLYAVLALAKGEAVTAADVHNAWAAWSLNNDDDHSALRPFEELDPATQTVDDHYVEAIRSAVRELPALAAKR